MGLLVFISCFLILRLPPNGVTLVQDLDGFSAAAWSREHYCKNSTSAGPSFFPNLGLGQHLVSCASGAACLPPLRARLLEPERPLCGCSLLRGPLRSSESCSAPVCSSFLSTQWVLSAYPLSIMKSGIMEGSGNGYLYTVVVLFGYASGIFKSLFSLSQKIFLSFESPGN